MYDIKSIMSSIMFKYCSDIFTELSSYKYAYIKGEALSYQAYGRLGQRTPSDIDILICRRNLGDIEKIMNHNGFRSSAISRADRAMILSYSHQLPQYVKQGNIFNVLVDVNFDIFWGEYNGKRIDMDDFLSDTVEMDIYGIKVKTIPPLKAMIQLILHHYKEMNSIYHLAGHNCINYNMFKDVYYLWINNKEDISLDKLYTISNEYKVIPYVFFVLYFTNQIFKDPDLEKYVEVFRTVEGDNLLDYYGLAEKERKLWRVDFQTRLEAENMYELIKEDLTEADTEKLERNRRIFG